MTPFDLGPLTAAKRFDWVLANVVTPTFAKLESLGGPRATKEAKRQTLAMGGQESRLVYRDQITNGPNVIGPATGLWQFEKMGGTLGVIRHNATKHIAATLCREAGLPFTQTKDGPEPSADAAWRRFVEDDMLACAFARLLLYTDPRPVPSTQTEGWACYLRTWRPGKPHPATWPAQWEEAEAALKRAGF